MALAYMAVHKMRFLSLQNDSKVVEHLARQYLEKNISQLLFIKLSFYY